MKKELVEWQDKWLSNSNLTDKDMEDMYLDYCKGGFDLVWDLWDFPSGMGTHNVYAAMEELVELMEK